MGHLWLGYNGLRGEIPRELGNLYRLSSLVLSENRLSGEIPHELGDLDNLQELSLEGNRLSGCVPSSLQDRLDTYYSDLGGLPFCAADP